MKRIKILLPLIIAFAAHSFASVIPDSLGLSGDNFNLYAVLDLFEQSKTFESFEAKLNEENSKINNLDLNNDGQTDYIKVIDNKQGDAHSIVLQVPINANEIQDVAVIEIEKDKTGKTQIQIIGNEDLYGEDYIVEPQTMSDANSKNTTTVINNNNTNVVYRYNTNDWAMMNYMYAPAYVLYVSPWRYNSYPTYYHAWHPWAWHRYYKYHNNHTVIYQAHFYRTKVYKNNLAHANYSPRKSVSVSYKTNRNQGVNKNTYHRKEHKNVMHEKQNKVNNKRASSPARGQKHGGNNRPK